MSLKLDSVTLTPQTVYTGKTFIISVDVYDDVFEFDASYNYDKHQGFGNAEQTIGGKLAALVIVYKSGAVLYIVSGVSVARSGNTIQIGG